MANSDRFIQAYNRIDRSLTRLLDADTDSGFGWMVRKLALRNPVIRRYQHHLEQFADLRNAIVHDTVDSFVIAEPNDRAVAMIEKIDRLLSSPSLVYPLFKSKVLRCAAADALPPLVQSMFQLSISQVPVYAGSRLVAVLTAATLTRWLGAQVHEDAFRLARPSVGDVLELAEDQASWAVISRQGSLVEALEVFTAAQQKGHGLSALLITESGKAHQVPLGIITAWDLPQISAALEL